MYEEFLYLNADIICLQEVEPATELFSMMRYNFGYDSAFAKKNKGKTDGQATFWSRRRFELLEKTKVAFLVNESEPNSSRIWCKP